MRLYISILFLLVLCSSVSANQMISAGDGSFSIANGDMLELTGYTNSTTAWLWMFTFVKNGDIVGAPVNISDGNFKVKISNTTKLPEGRYTMVVEFGGPNKIQEVLYDFNKSEFTSPWREPKILRASDNPYERIKQIELYCKNAGLKYCDDTFYTTNVTVEKPFVKVTDMYQYTFSDIYTGKSDEQDISKSGMLYFAGETNIDPSVPLKIILDNNQTVMAVTEQPDPYGYYKWTAFLDISKLRPGSHPIRISSPKIDDMITYLDIGYTRPTPKPTPTPIKVVSNSFVSAAGNTVSGPSTVTVKPTATSNTFVSVPTQTIRPVQPTPTLTPLPNTEIDPVTGMYRINVTPAPTKSNKLPLNPMISIIGVFTSIIAFSFIKKFK